jgi:hypothetical protein
MRDFFNSVLTMLMFIVAVCLFYTAATVTFYSSVMNIIIFIIAIFVLLQGAGNIDKTHHFGKYAVEPDDNNDAEPGPHHEKPQEHHKKIQPDN